MNLRKHYLALFAVLLAIIVVFAAGCTTTTPAPSVPSAPASTVSPLVTSATSTPNVVGVWTGTTAGHARIEGFREHKTARYNITEQKGLAFTGNKEYTRADGNVYYENLSGVISSDRKIYIADHTSGTVIGEFIGPDEVELINLQPGDDAKAFIIHLTRQTS